MKIVRPNSIRVGLCLLLSASVFSKIIIPSIVVHVVELVTLLISPDFSLISKAVLLSSEIATALLLKYA
jgi:hypothetical protein